MPLAGEGFVTNAAGIRQFVIKTGTTLVAGDVFVFTATNDEIDLPAAANAIIVGGIVRTGGVGVAAGTGLADVYLKGFGQIVYAVASAAIGAGKDISSAGANGKTAVTVTAGARLGYALDNATADNEVYRVVI